MRFKYPYHGSSKPLKGEYLLPRQAHDLGGNPENMYCAVYATPERDIAIARALLSCEGVRASSLYFTGRIPGVIYEGWPSQEYIYLYTLPIEKFRQTDKNSKQWVSFEPVKPIRSERLAVKDYLHLIRKASLEEREEWYNKYRLKLHR